MTRYCLPHIAALSIRREPLSTAISSSARLLRLAVVVVGAIFALGGARAADNEPSSTSAPPAKSVITSKGKAKKGSHTHETTAASAIPDQRYFSSALSQQIFSLLYAEMLLLRGETLEAARITERLAYLANDPDVYKRAATLLAATGDDHAIMRLSGKWLKREPDSREAHQRMVQALLRDKRLIETAPHFIFLVSHPRERTGDNLLGINSLFAGFTDKAQVAQLIALIAKAFPDRAEASMAMALAELAAGQKSRAEAHAVMASQQKPDWEIPVLFRAGNLGKSTDEAIGLFDQHLALHPEARLVWQQRIRLLTQAKRYDEADQSLRSALQQKPDDVDLQHALGLLSLERKNYPEAEALFKRLLQSDQVDRLRVRFLLAQTYERAGRADEAIGQYREITIGDQYLPARMRIASLIAKQGKLDDAIRLLRETPVADSDSRVQLIIAESQLLREADKATEAYQTLLAGLKTYPENTRLLYDAALSADQLQLYGDMEKKLRLALRKEPNNPHFLNALGYSFAERNVRISEAESLIQKALTFAPNDAHIIDSQGWVLFRQGRVADAYETLKRAYQVMPDPEIAAHMIEVLWAQGSQADARQLLEAVLKDSPDHGALKKIRERLMID